MMQSDPSAMTDPQLVDAYERIDGEPGDPVSDALIDGIEERGLDV